MPSQDANFVTSRSQTAQSDGFPGKPRGNCPNEVDPRSKASVGAFLSGHEFPFADGDGFHFAFVDPSGRVEAVRLRHGLAGHRESQWFTRCEGGVFLMQFTAPAVLRLEYQFGIVLPNGTEETIADPLNPHSVRDPFSSKSVACAEGYAVPLYAGPPPDEAVGSLFELSLPGPGEQPWRSWLWSPPGAELSQTLPLLMVLDGGDYLRLSGLRNVLENLVWSGAMRPCRAVLMSPSARNDEYSANDATARYLTAGLPEMLSDLIPIPDQANERFAVGASLGGLCLLHAHFTHPGFFGGLLLQSGSYFQPRTDAMEVHFRHFDRITAFVQFALTQPINVPRIPMYITCGRGGENLTNNRIMAGSLRDNGYPITFVEHPDAHNWTSWRDCIGGGLASLVGKNA